MIIDSVPSLNCLRCGHTWIPRQPNVRVCPNCTSAYWDTPRKMAKNFGVAARKKPVAPVE